MLQLVSMSFPHTARQEIQHACMHSSQPPTDRLFHHSRTRSSASNRQTPPSDSSLQRLFAPEATTRSIALHDVLKVVAEADLCQDLDDTESGWNIIVHGPLLYASLFGQMRGQQLVGFRPWFAQPLRSRVQVCLANTVSSSTTAKIIPEHVPWRTSGKMIDYVMCIEPNNDGSDPLGIDQAIKALRRSHPYQVVNHTDFLALRERPICVSIETKRRGRGQDGAELQVGIWHAAQWHFLAQQAGDGCARLEYLLAIVVQGHECSFTATTYEDGKTVSSSNCASRSRLRSRSRSRLI